MTQGRRQEAGLLPLAALMVSLKAVLLHASQQSACRAGAVSPWWWVALSAKVCSSAELGERRTSSPCFISPTQQAYRGPAVAQT